MASARYSVLITRLLLGGEKRRAPAFFQNSLQRLHAFATCIDITPRSINSFTPRVLTRRSPLEYHFRTMLAGFRYSLRCALPLLAARRRAVDVCSLRRSFSQLPNSNNSPDLAASSSPPLPSSSDGSDSHTTGAISADEDFSDIAAASSSSAVFESRQGVNSSGASSRTQPPGFVPGRYAIVYTCEVCELRSAKTFSKHAYTKGVVLIRCDGCKNLHMIADNLGWFEHGQNIEQIYARMGREISKLDSTSAQQLVDIEPQLQQFVLQAEQEHAAAGAGSTIGAIGADGAVATSAPARDEAHSNKTATKTL
jgi:hypothetical protein